MPDHVPLRARVGTPSSASILAVIAQRARTMPTETALGQVTFTGREPITSSVTYGSLLRGIENAATILDRSCVTFGERVLLSISGAADFLSFFFGAQCLGAIPVALPAASELPERAYFNRVSAVARDARPCMLVLDDARAAEGLSEELKTGIAIEHVSSLGHQRGQEDAPACLNLLPQPNDIAFLQYTSGSTGAPKGVVVLHRNVMANLRACVEAGSMDCRDVSYSWLPLYHDMGLVGGLLLGLYVGMATYVAQPKTFIARPDSWLRAITKFRATISPGPNFAFDILARRVPDRALSGVDLSSWRLAFDGAEPVDPHTVRAFIDRFASHGFRERSFRPAYGMAECTLTATFARPEMPTRFDCVDRVLLEEHGVAKQRFWLDCDRPRHARLSTEPNGVDPPNSATYTSVGIALPDHQFRILDVHSDRELPERHLGEVALSGPSLTPGYFQELLEGAPPRTELRTGDLGYVVAGELFVVDRLKDLIILAGRKYAPADIERAVGSISGVRNGSVVAFSARAETSFDELFILSGLEPSGKSNKDDLRLAIRRAVYENFGVTPAVILFTRPGNIPRTSSGKLRRSMCRVMWESGQLSCEDPDGTGLGPRQE
jgi:acyl-CoA synthetase (AMP-forming)/AMP-acid ligase II